MTLNNQTVVVMGAGIAGVSAALQLAERGANVKLIERDDFIGGYAGHMACKATDACQSCNLCLAETRFNQVLLHPKVEIIRRTQISDFEKRPGGFDLHLVQRPAYVDTEACTGCGICLERCPAVDKGAFREPTLAQDPVRLAVDPATCLFFKDQKSTLCSDFCPENAIDFALEAREIHLAANAVVLATGFIPYHGPVVQRYGHGTVDGVMTACELEELLREGLAPPQRRQDGQGLKAAFIQCVGSRRRQDGNNYCSRVCCGYALRMARLLHARHQAQVSVFYMDLQSFGHAFDDFLQAAQSELRLVRAIPSHAWPAPQGGVQLGYLDDRNRQVDEDFDLLTLSVGMSPAPGNSSLAQLTGLTLDDHGFIADNGNGSGIFTAGSVSGPMDVSESLIQGERAALQVAAYFKEAS